MPIDPSAVGRESRALERSWTSKDALLYALGVGAGADAPDSELEFTTENTEDVQQLVLPTFAVIIGHGKRPDIGKYDPTKLVHGEQSIEFASVIPVSGTVRSTTTVTGIYDKGSGAVVATETRSVDAASEKAMFTTRSSVFIRGEGGFGGDRGPSAGTFVLPERAPDHVVIYPTRKDQALLYRLSGDRNPLHSDPAFAKRGGFERPILHGLCTYGFTGRALLHSICGGDPARFRAIEGRFSKPVLPGEPLTVEVWVEGSVAAFRTKNGTGDVVIDRGKLRFEAG